MTVLDIRRPEDHRNGESEAQPKLVTKHGDGVSRVTVVTCGGSRHIVDDMRTNWFVIVVRHVVHFGFSGTNSPCGIASVFKRSARNQTLGPGACILM